MKPEVVVSTWDAFLWTWYLASWSWLSPEELTPGPLSSLKLWTKLDCCWAKQHPDWLRASGLPLPVLSCYLRIFYPWTCILWLGTAGPSSLIFALIPFLFAPTSVFQTTHMLSPPPWLALPAFPALGSQGRCQRLGGNVPFATHANGSHDTCLRNIKTSYQKEGKKVESWVW